MPNTVVFCVTCKGRAHHIRQTLPKNLIDNPNAKFVILNYNSRDGLFNYILETYPNEIACGRVVLYSNYDRQVFHMAHAKNQAHRLGIREGGDILVNLDADNITGSGFADYLQCKFAGHKNDMFMWARMIHGELDRGISGRIAVTRSAFLLAGGYDQKFATWSPDDADFRCRLQQLGLTGSEIDPVYLRAVKHSDKARFREYPHVQPGCYDQGNACRPESNIVNAGGIGTGVVYRNDCEIPIHINPIPTRIFGIGMHKTGTSSLHAAFKMIGLNAAHWNTALWARAVTEEVKRDGRSSTVDEHYAFSDLPFPLLFRELDKAYPGSKFILTIRPEQDWLRSVRNHWDAAINPYRKDWDIAPFTHRVHQMLYGRKTFDAGVFLARYRAHNAEVLEYFKDRPGDLLVMDMARGGEWGLLCQMVGVFVPSAPYPRKLVTDEYRLNYEI